MTLWAGYLGSGNEGDEGELRRLLGDQADIYASAGVALGTRGVGGGPARLNRAPDGAPGGAVSVTSGQGEAITSATFHSASATLVLQRDPFGLHSLYTTQRGATLWFASDPRLLAQLPGATPQWEAQALHGYLCFSYVPTPHTLFAGVTQLAAGERQVFQSADTVSREPGAAWQEGPRLEISAEQALVELRQHLRAAVARGLGAARDVGVFLSGGLDSSLVAALLVELGAHPHLFTLDFGPPYDAELAYARAVAAHLRQPLQVVPARPAQIRAALRPTAQALQQPFGDGVTVPLYLLGQAAAQRVNHIFNGEGGDQLFGGWALKPMLAAELYADAEYNRAAAYLKTYHRLHGVTHQFYTAAARHLTDRFAVGDWVRPALNAPGFTTLLHRLRAANLWLKGAQNIAPRVTQLAAAHGLTMHAPFFDSNLAQWTFSLPPEWLLHGTCEKYLLKRVAAPYLPTAVVWREKRGMGVPTTDWCLGPLRREVEHWLNPHRLKQAGWFEPEAVAALRRGELLATDSRQRRVGELLWLMLMLHLWLDVHAPTWAWPTKPLGS